MTLLETIWNADGNEADVVAKTAEKLANGELVLTGNFKGREIEIAKEIEKK